VIDQHEKKDLKNIASGLMQQIDLAMKNCKAA